ncbi:hypothetical protein ACFQH8_11665 [Halomicroarcula sp. GCM10025710]
MSSEQSFDVMRAVATVVAVGVLGTLVGYFQQGSLAGALTLGLTVAAAVAVGIVIFDRFFRYVQR